MNVFTIRFVVFFQFQFQFKSLFIVISIVRIEFTPVVEIGVNKGQK